MRWIPAARSSQWWMLAGVSSLVTTILLWVIRFVLLGQPFSGMHAFRFMLLAAGLSLFFSAVGWLGARMLWLFSSIGVVLGLVMMAVYSQDMTGWEDLISFIVFLEVVAGGFIVGLAVEGFLFVKRLMKNN